MKNGGEMPTNVLSKMINKPFHICKIKIKFDFNVKR